MAGMLARRHVLALAAGGLAAPWVARAPVSTPGVTETSIRIGQTMPYGSASASAYGIIGRTEAAFFRMLNVGGGVSNRMMDLLAVDGRTIELVSVDDGYSPLRTVQETRRLVESEGVAFMFNSVGTACQGAVRQYLNARKVPQLFVATGADEFANPERFPWTMPWQPSFRTEARIYARHLLREAPGTKLAVLYQNDDFGKDYLIGLKDALGPKYDQVVVAAAPYEVTDATVDHLVVSLQRSGADALLTAATPTFAAQAIRALAAIGWHPSPHYLTYASASATAVMLPAGGEHGRGIISAAYLKDPTDPRWADDPGISEWRAFMHQWMSEADLRDSYAVYGYGVALTLKRVLEQCGDNLSRANVIRQAANLHDLGIPVLLPGITVNTSLTDHRPIQQMHLTQWTGTTWELFGEVVSDT